MSVWKREDRIWQGSVSVRERDAGQGSEGTIDRRVVVFGGGCVLHGRLCCSLPSPFSAGWPDGWVGWLPGRSPARRVLPVCAPVRCWPAGQKDGYASWHVGVRETACSHPRTSTSSCSKVGRVPWPSHGEQLVRFLWVDREQGRGGEIHLRFILPYGNTRATATVY